jgi:hypothetical protein
MAIPQTPSPLAAILLNKTYNAAWFSGATIEAQIQNALNAANTDGAAFVLIPKNMEGYNPALVTPVGTVQIVTETKLMLGGTGGLTVLDVTGFNGATAGDKIIAAINSLGGTTEVGPAVLDMRRFTGVQIINKVIADQAIPQYAKAPLVWLWGSATYWLSVLQKAMSNHIHLLDGATLVFGKNANGSRQTGVYGFLHQGLGCQLTTVAGSGVVTLWPNSTATINGVVNSMDIGHTLGIFGHIPRGGRDNTTVGADPGPAGTSIQVASTTGFATGFIIIPNNAATDYEIIQYTSTDATHFLGCTRGYAGTTAVAHNVGTAVDRCVYETYIIKSIAGTTITLDEGRTVPFTSTFIDAQKGPFGFTIDGHGTIDGNMDPVTDDLINPQGIYVWYARYGYAGNGLIWRNWDHSCVAWFASQDCYTYGRMLDSTRPSVLLGSATWLFTNCKRCTVEIDVENTYIGCYVDSRTTIPGFSDNPSDDNTVIIRHARNVVNPIRESGGSGNYLEVRSARDLPATGVGIAEDSDNQWITPANVQGKALRNTFVIRTVTGAAGFNGFAISSTWGGQQNHLVNMCPGVVHSIPDGMAIGYTPPKSIVPLALAATVVTNASLGDHFEITDTAPGTARTIQNPTNSVEDQDLTYDVYNNSGGALGAYTFDTQFKLAGAWVQPANGQRRMITFKRRNGAWRETSRTAADQPN